MDTFLIARIGNWDILLVRIENDFSVSISIVLYIASNKIVDTIPGWFYYSLLFRHVCPRKNFIATIHSDKNILLNRIIILLTSSIFRFEHGSKHIGLNFIKREGKEDKRTNSGKNVGFRNQTSAPCYITGVEPWRNFCSRR